MKPSEKLQSLLKYRADHEARLSAPTPEKHKNHPEDYKNYLKLEIKKVTVTIDKLKMNGAEGK